MPDASPSDGGAAAFEALRSAIEAQPHGAILLEGPGSPARRRLLEALPTRLRDGLECVWLEERELSPAAVWLRIVAALGVTPGYDARRRVLQILEDRVLRSGGLVVLVPEAETLAGDSLSSLMNNARTERGLHLVLASTSARALAARLPEDATVIAWNGEPPAALPPRPPSTALGETAGERIDTAASEASPSRPASREGRSGAAFRGAALLLAAGLALVFAWGLSRSRSPEPAEREPSATGEPSAAPEPTRPAPAVIPAATVSQAPTASAAEAVPAAAAAEPVPQPAEPIADATQRNVPPEIAAVPRPAPEAAPPPESPQLAPPTGPAEAGAPEPATAPSPPEPAAAAAPEPAATPRAAPPPQPAATAPAEPDAALPPKPAATPAPKSVARATEPTRPSPAPAPPAPAPAAPPPLARGALRVDSEVPVRIEIDGKPYGSTPLAGIRLPRGRHRIVARYPDGASALKSVTLGDEDVAVSYR